MSTNLTAQEEADALAQSMSLLSPEERAAIEGDTDDMTDAINQLGNNGDTEERDLPAPTEQEAEEPEEADDEEPEDAPAEEPAAQEAPAAPAEEAEAVAEPAAAPAAEQPAARNDAFTYNAPPVEDFDGKMKALAAERRDAMSKLMAGEITDAEYSEIDERVLSQREALRDQQNRHVVAKEMSEQALQADWNRNVASVKAQAKAEGIDYEADAKMGKAWDRWVRQLGADPENNDRPAEWFLKEAHNLVKVQYGLGHVAAKDAPPPKKEEPAAPPKPQRKAPDLSKIPPTLANAPAAEVASEGDDSEFAYIDKLQGIARERALAKLTPEQEARYLES